MFTSQQLEILKGLFHEFDVNGDGKIDRNEMRAALLRYDLAPSLQEFNMLWSSMDSDGKGFIDFASFSTGIGARIGGCPVPEDLVRENSTSDCLPEGTPLHSLDPQEEPSTFETTSCDDVNLSRVHDLEMEIRSLERTNSQLKSRLVEVMSDSDRLHQDLDTRSQALAQAKATITFYEQRKMDFDAQNEQLGDAQEKLENLLHEYALLQTKYSLERADHAKLKNAYASEGKQLKEEIEFLETNLQNAKTPEKKITVSPVQDRALEGLRSEIAQMKVSLDASQAALKEQEKTAEGALRSLLELRSQKSSLEAENAELREQLEASMMDSDGMAQFASTPSIAQEIMSTPPPAQRPSRKQSVAPMFQCAVYKCLYLRRSQQNKENLAKIEELTTERSKACKIANDAGASREQMATQFFQATERIQWQQQEIDQLCLELQKCKSGIAPVDAASVPASQPTTAPPPTATPTPPSTTADYSTTPTPTPAVTSTPAATPPPTSTTSPAAQADAVTPPPPSSTSPTVQSDGAATPPPSGDQSKSTSSQSGWFSQLAPLTSWVGWYGPRSSASKAEDHEYSLPALKELFARQTDRLRSVEEQLSCVQAANTVLEAKNTSLAVQVHRLEVTIGQLELDKHYMGVENSNLKQMLASATPLKEGGDHQVVSSSAQDHIAFLQQENVDLLAKLNTMEERYHKLLQSSRNSASQFTREVADLLWTWFEDDTKKRESSRIGRMVLPGVFDTRANSNLRALIDSLLGKAERRQQEVEALKTEFEHMFSLRRQVSADSASAADNDGKEGAASRTPGLTPAAGSRRTSHEARQRRSSSSALSVASAGSDGSSKEVQDLLQQEHDANQAVSFYSLCVSIKLSLAAQNTGKNILIQDLFEKAKKKKVPESEWSDFIHSHMAD